MGIYFPNVHFQFYSNNFGWLLHSFPFLWLQQPLCMYSREHNVTFVFSRIWLRRLCSCKWIQVLGLTARNTGTSREVAAFTPGHLSSQAEQTHIAPPCTPLPTLKVCFFFLEFLFSLILHITFSDFYMES